MTQILDVAKSPIKRPMVKEKLFLPNNFKKTISVKPNDYDEDIIKEKIVWDTQRISYAEYLASGDGKYKTDFEVAIIPDIFFANKGERNPEDLNLSLFDPNIEKLTIFEFVQFTMLVRPRFYNSVYIPIGLQVKEKTRPLCVAKSLIEFRIPIKVSLRGSIYPSYQYGLYDKFFVAKVV